LKTTSRSATTTDPMFHGKHTDARLDRAAVWAGLELDATKRNLLAEFGAWLAREGVEAGGVGPDEAPRIVDRHVADSLVFAGGWDAAPPRVLDVGTGAGLPGIPLAIALPETAFTLLDRSERRCRLARRAVRVLALQNVSVEQRDVGDVTSLWPVMVFRASLTPERALAVAAPRLEPTGCAVVGLSRSTEPEGLPDAPFGTVLDLLHTAPGVLDSASWLLTMTRTDERTEDGNPA